MPVPALLLALAVAAADSTTFIRVNQVGYLPDAPKAAVVCSLDSTHIATFLVRDRTGRTVFGPRRAEPTGSFGPCVATHRLDFTELRRPGRYTIETQGGNAVSREFRIGADVYAGGADTLLYYLRQQRSGWNPYFRDSVHRYDGYVVDDTGGVVKFLPVSGGWADASDFLQYVTTSATAAYMLLAAARDHPGAFADAFDARGLPGANGVPDALDEARHGLEWLSRMYPGGDEMYNQLADDRDHAFPDLLVNDSSEYGWGKGRHRPVYPCTGRPQGLFQHKNRSTGYASTAGKYASAFALGAALFADRDPGFAAVMRRKSVEAYELGRRFPGACQTAPGRAPYFYEEDSWADDMELGAAELFALTRDLKYFDQGLEYAAIEPVTPWMGADTARHYQWFPWHNNGHYALWRTANRVNAMRVAASRRDSSGPPGLARPAPMDVEVVNNDRPTLVGYYRRGLDAVVARANNGFRVGIPFIWCSNNLMTSFATQAMLYRRMTRDESLREYEQASVDWLFGVNPWGVSMVVGYPRGGVTAQDPHSTHAKQLGVDVIMGGLLDGPVYRSIYQNLRGIHLTQPDEYERFNTGFIVYHDDYGDYSTNEPIMDGTANLVYLLASLAPQTR